MKGINFFKYLVYLVFLSLAFLNCSSAQKIQSSIPIEFGDVYYQHWIAGVKGGGSGINVFINVVSNKKNIELDSVYFQGKVSKLEEVNNSLFIGRFKTTANQREDLIMSSNPKEEYGNQIHKPKEDIPFELKNNQCIISYNEGSKIKYFMIEDIKKKKLLAYPSAPQ
jgi:hypothetical protein